MPLGSRQIVLALAAALLCACPSPPPSQFPTAGDALQRMRETHACSRGVGGEATIDYFNQRGRVKGNLLYIAMLPDSLRFDVYSPFGVILSTLTTDGKRFALRDFREKQFLQGEASACNVARFTQVPVPPHALAQLLRGEAPVLVHTAQAASIAWDSGHYVVRLDSKHAAREEIHLEPHPDDWGLHFSQQRVRVLRVRVEQQGIDLYSAELADHEPAQTAAPRRDPDGLSAPLLPSGPACAAEVPRRIRLEVPDGDQDVIVRYKDVVHNPPLSEDVFSQRPARGFSVRYVTCGR